MKKVLTLILTMLMCVIFVPCSFASSEVSQLKKQVSNLQDLTQNAVVILKKELELKRLESERWCLVETSYEQSKKIKISSLSNSSYTAKEVAEKHAVCDRDMKCLKKAILDIKLLGTESLDYTVNLDFLKAYPVNFNQTQKQYYYVRMLLAKMYNKNQKSLIPDQKGSDSALDFGISDDYYWGFHVPMLKAKNMESYYYAAAVLLKAEKLNIKRDYVFY